jgi:cobalt/nickel transport system permease protein
MLNFPVIGGTSGHLIGAVLAGALLGPSAAVIVLSAVLVVQCFVFADGGITALGANIFNMALIGGVGGWLVYYPISRMVKGLFGRLVAAIVAAWCSTMLAAVACAGELTASGTVAWSTALPAMGGVHMLIGIGEGVITAIVLAATWTARPELQDATTLPTRSFKPLLAYGTLIALGLALFVSPFACPWPDGLDKTAEDLGFKDRESEHRAIAAIAPDYKMPGLRSEGMATAMAGGAGTLAVFGLAWVVAGSLVPRKAKEAAEASTAR